MDILKEVLSGDFSSAYTFISDRMNGMLQQLLTNTTFKAILDYFCILASVIAVVYFLLDLVDMYSNDNFSVEAFLKEFMKLIVVMLLMNNLSALLIGLSDFSNAIGDAIVNIVGTVASDSDSAQFGIITKTLGIANGTSASAENASGPVLSQLGDVFNFIIGMISLISIQFLCYWLSVRRTLNILWQVALSPIAIADFCRNNSTSSGIRTIKSLLDCFLEAPIAVAVCIVIDAVTASPGALNILAAIVGIKLLWQYFLAINNYGQRVVNAGNSGLVKY
jgi:hypothetical protein